MRSLGAAFVAPRRCLHRRPPPGRAEVVSMAPADEPRASSSLTVLATALPLVAALVFVVSSGGPGPALAVVQSSVDGAGAWGPLLFGAGYAASVVSLLPAAPLTLAAGLLFGPVEGTAVVSAAATAGAAAAFLLARSALRPLVETQLRRVAGKRFEALDAGIAAGGFRVVCLVRLSPLFPFSISNYVLGLTNVAFPDYVLATWLGALPGTFAFVLIGSTADAAASGLPPIKIALYVLGAAATLLITSYAARLANEALSVKDKDSSET